MKSPTRRSRTTPISGLVEFPFGWLHPATGTESAAIGRRGRLFFGVRQEMDQAHLTDLLVDGATECIDSLVGEEDAAAITGFGIFTDDTANSCYAAYSKDPDQRFDLESWLPVESQSLDQASNLLDRYYTEDEDYENDPDWHTRHREGLFSSALAALEKLRAMRALPDTTFLILWVNGSDTSTNRRREWALRLNTEGVAVGFEEWCQTRNDEEQALLAKMLPGGN